MGTKVNVNVIGINEKLARKYNAMVNFINKNTIFEDGCFNMPIVDIEYVRENKKNELFKTDDYIKIIISSCSNNIIWLNNPRAIKIDRKYNCLVKNDEYIMI